MPSPTVSGSTIIEEPPLFSETQRFLPPPLSLALLMVMGAVAAWVLFAGLLRGAEWLPLAVGAGVTLLFHLLELRVTVRRHQVEIHYRPIYRRRIDPADIRSCEARTYRPILEYGGWGLRRGWKGGWAYNVRGNRGAQLTLQNGSSALIGSQRAEELATAIRDVAGLPAARS